MSTHVTYAGVRSYWRHALVVTLALTAVPVLGVMALVFLSPTGVPSWFAFVTGVVLALAVRVAGSAIWSRRPESVDLNFNELVIWGWLRRKRAEERASEDAHLLGLDRSGRPLKRTQLPRSRQLPILNELTDALELKDPYTHGHSQRVERHARRTAERLGLSAEELGDLERAAGLHDVGKIRVPQRILRKPEPLERDERALVEEHVQVGAWLVASVCSRRVVQAVRHHHERWDGRGYPDGLSGHDIPLFARVIAVADAFDAMTSTRAYRVAFSREHAISVLREEAGRQFDGEVVEAFLSTLPTRVPVAALVPVLGTSNLLERYGASLRKVWQQVAQPTTAAAGLAAAMTAVSLAPAAPVLKPRSPAPAIAPAEGIIVGESVSLPSEQSADGLRLMGSSGGSASRPAAGLGRASGVSHDPAAPSRSGHQPEEEETAPADGGTTEVEDPAPPVDPGAPESKPKKQKDNPPPDPQPTKGRDCVDHPEDGSGPGNSKHCDEE